MKVFRYNILQGLQNDKNLEFLLNLSPWENWYLARNIFQKWFLIWTENLAQMIGELINKWVQKDDILSILQTNSVWIIDIAKSAKLNFLLQNTKWSTFVFDKNNTLKFNIQQSELKQFFWWEKINYQGCPMLYERWQQSWVTLLVDFEILTAKLLLHYLKT